MTGYYQDLNLRNHYHDIITFFFLFPSSSYSGRPLPIIKFINFLGRKMSAYANSQYSILSS